MSPAKKLVFAPLFILATTSMFYFYKLILDKYLEVFLLSYGGLLEFSTMIIPLMLAGLFYILYLTFTQDFKYAVSLALLSGFIPAIFFDFNSGLVLGISLFFILLLSFFNMQLILKSYINFQPTALLIGPVKLLNTFILLILTFGYFLHTNSIIQTQGFKIPDSVIDWAVNISLNQSGIPVRGEKYLAQIPTLSEEQLELLRQNPEILEQYGIKPSDLDVIGAKQPEIPQSPNRNAVQVIPQIPGVDLNSILRTQISNALDAMIKPYLFAIPFLLALIFYSFGSLILWILSMLIYPTSLLIFYIFDKTGFVKYEKEMREVKKIVV